MRRDHVNRIKIIKGDGGRCAACGKARPTMACGECLDTLYCNEACQRVGWYENNHASTCKRKKTKPVGAHVVNDPTHAIDANKKVAKNDGPLEIDEFITSYPLTVRMLGRVYLMDLVGKDRFYESITINKVVNALDAVVADPSGSETLKAIILRTLVMESGMNEKELQKSGIFDFFSLFFPSTRSPPSSSFSSIDDVSKKIAAMKPFEGKTIKKTPSMMRRNVVAPRTAAVAFAHPVGTQITTTTTTTTTTPATTPPMTTTTTTTFTTNMEREGAQRLETFFGAISPASFASNRHDEEDEVPPLPYEILNDILVLRSNDPIRSFLRLGQWCHSFYDNMMETLCTDHKKKHLLFANETTIEALISFQERKLARNETIPFIDIPAIETTKYGMIDISLVNRIRNIRSIKGHFFGGYGRDRRPFLGPDFEPEIPNLSDTYKNTRVKTPLRTLPPSNPSNDESVPKRTEWMVDNDLQHIPFGSVFADPKFQSWNTLTRLEGTFFPCQAMIDRLVNLTTLRIEIPRTSHFARDAFFRGDELSPNDYVHPLDDTYHDHNLPTDDPYPPKIDRVAGGYHAFFQKYMDPNGKDFFGMRQYGVMHALEFSKLKSLKTLSLKNFKLRSDLIVTEGPRKSKSGKDLRGRPCLKTMFGTFVSSDDLARCESITSLTLVECDLLYETTFDLTDPTSSNPFFSQDDVYDEGDGTFSVELLSTKMTYLQEHVEKVEKNKCVDFLSNDSFFPPRLEKLKLRGVLVNPTTSIFFGELSPPWYRLGRHSLYEPGSGDSQETKFIDILDTDVLLGTQRALVLKSEYMPIRTKSFFRNRNFLLHHAVSKLKGLRELKYYHLPPYEVADLHRDPFTNTESDYLRTSNRIEDWNYLFDEALAPLKYLTKLSVGTCCNRLNKSEYEFVSADGSQLNPSEVFKFSSYHAAGPELNERIEKHSLFEYERLPTLGKKLTTLRLIIPHELMIDPTVQEKHRTILEKMTSLDRLKVMMRDSGRETNVFDVVPPSMISRLQTFDIRLVPSLGSLSDVYIESASLSNIVGDFPRLKRIRSKKVALEQYVSRTSTSGTFINHPSVILFEIDVPDITPIFPALKKFDDLIWEFPSRELASYPYWEHDLCIPRTVTTLKLVETRIPQFLHSQALVSSVPNLKRLRFMEPPLPVEDDSRFDQSSDRQQYHGPERHGGRDGIWGLGWESLIGLKKLKRLEIMRYNSNHEWSRRYDFMGHFTYGDTALCWFINNEKDSMSYYGRDLGWNFGRTLRSEDFILSTHTSRKEVGKNAFNTNDGATTEYGSRSSILSNIRTLVIDQKRREYKSKLTVPLFLRHQCSGEDELLRNDESTFLIESIIMKELASYGSLRHLSLYDMAITNKALSKLSRSLKSLSLIESLPVSAKTLQQFGKLERLRLGCGISYITKLLPVMTIHQEPWGKREKFFEPMPEAIEMTRKRLHFKEFRSELLEEKLGNACVHPEYVISRLLSLKKFVWDLRASAPEYLVYREETLKMLMDSKHIPSYLEIDASICNTLIDFKF